MKKQNRREFLKATSLMGAVGLSAMIVPRHLLGGTGFVPPGEKVHIGYVGCGTQGMRQMLEALVHPGIRIVAVCDPNRKSDDYPEWGRNELNDKIRNFLGDDSWANNARGGLCGREVGQEVVERHYAKKGQCSRQEVGLGVYKDFREMLQEQKDLDAVYNMTPDHLHGVVAIRSIRAGKHIITHKPFSNILAEARTMRDLAASNKNLATQLFCSADQTQTPRVAEWIAAGAIGSVREVHNVSVRPFWPQGMLNYPTDTPAVPSGLDWNLWLGPAADRPYHPAYEKAVFRGWYDFGTGAIGDMGHYSFHQIFEALNLGSPTSVEASHSEYWAVNETGWTKQINQVSYPQSSWINWEFDRPASTQDKIRLSWYDGGIHPPQIEELERLGEPTPEEYILYVGDDGKILCDFMGNNPRILRANGNNSFAEPAVTLPRPKGELEQFVIGCRGEASPEASFDKAYPFAESILLGTIALRCSGKLLWDSERFEFDNQEANNLKYRVNRPGWEV